MLGVGASLVAGCVSTQKHARNSSLPARQWIAALAFAESTAHTGAYAATDSALSAFQHHFPGTPQSAESIYWRALFRLDPNNVTATPASVVETLDQYLALPNHAAHETEALLLRRTAVLIGSMQGATESAEEAADSARTKADSAKAEVDSVKTARAVHYRSMLMEVQRLRDSLDKVLLMLSDTTQELNRIKKRLAEPAPTTGSSP